MTDDHRLTVHDYTSGESESTEIEDINEATSAYKDACESHSPIHYSVTLDRDNNRG